MRAPSTSTSPSLTGTSSARRNHAGASGWIGPALMGRSSGLQRHLDGARLILGRQHLEGGAPVVERERVREHRSEIDAASADEIEVVRDAVLAHTVDGLDAERVRADPGDLLEIQR